MYRINPANGSPPCTKPPQFITPYKNIPLCIYLLTMRYKPPSTEGQTKGFFKANPWQVFTVRLKKPLRSILLNGRVIFIA